MKTMDFVEEAVEIAKAVQVLFFLTQLHIILSTQPLQAKSKKLADFKAVLAEDSGVVAQCADLKSR